jgi:hypothetical protein
MPQCVGHSLRISTKPKPFDLERQRLLDRLLAALAMLLIEQRAALHVAGAGQPGDHLRNAHRRTLHPSASIGRGGRPLAHERGGSHLSAGHSVDRVVDEHHADRDAELCGMDDLRQADRRQIAVALIADHDRFGICQLVSERHGGRAPVGRLRVAGIEVVEQKNRAADRRHHHAALLDAELHQCFGHELVRQTVPATGAVVGAAALQPLAVRVTLEMLEQGRCRAHCTTSVTSRTIV